mmetsp:Transcript_7232/g.12214  ORF Transcript_7232/g.12214 Transcript_7232/m.12214 type:complete len:83 (-) Transcript_7232:1420-1668(-)
MLDSKYFDNVYAEVKRSTNVKRSLNHRKKKLVNRRTQTYLRELLQIEGEPQYDSDMEVVFKDELEFEGKDYVQNLINAVIEG